jgi:hypothetical protein
MKTVEIRTPPQNIARAARRYLVLRRLFWSCWIGPALLVIAAIALPLNAIEFMLIWIGAVGGLIAGFILGALVFEFRCPRCDQLFAAGSNRLGFPKFCENCALNLQEAARTTG